MPEFVSIHKGIALKELQEPGATIPHIFLNALQNLAQLVRHFGIKKKAVGKNTPGPTI